MMIRLLAAVLSVTLLAGCGSRPAPAGEDVPPPANTGHALEDAARDAGLVDDPATTSPAGLYRNVHAGGSDSLCMRATGGNSYRVGMIASFGPTLICEASGSASHDGATLSLDLGDGCAFEAQYDARSIRLPGVVPAACAARCGARASLSGVHFDRSSWSEADALRVRSRRDAARGAPLCG